MRKRKHFKPSKEQREAALQVPKFIAMASGDRLPHRGCLTYIVTANPPSTSTGAKPATSTAKYRLRFFFDGMSGHCLWAGNEATCKQFGYTIDLDDLRLKPHIANQGMQLLKKWETKQELSLSLVRSANYYIEQLRSTLGPEFEIVNAIFGEEI